MGALPMALWQGGPHFALEEPHQGRVGGGPGPRGPGDGREGLLLLNAAWGSAKGVPSCSLTFKRYF